MNKKEAEDLMSQYNQHWGVDKSFDIGVTNLSDNAAELLTMLHRPESMSDEEKLSVIKSLRFDSLYIKTHQATKERFITTLDVVLSSLLDAVRCNNAWKAELIITEILAPILQEREVTEGINQNVKSILEMFDNHQK
ncbi:hypothetical protein VPHK250G1_0082 [Vibrio phage K250 g1]